MRTLAALVAGGLVATAPAAVAQPGVFSAATMPTPAQLRPLNLTPVWTTAIPVEGQKDGVELVQVVDANQVFAQTRSGVLVALDAVTGAQQWAARYDTPYAPVIPVAVNEKYVFAVNVIRLYCFQRYTGVVEWAYNLPMSPQSGPAVDDTHVFITIGSGRVAALAMPNPITMPDKALTRRAEFPGAGTSADPRAANPAAVVAGRYPSGNRRLLYDDERFEESRIRLSEPAAGLATLQRSPSLSTLPTMAPPYRLFDDRGKYLFRTESLSTVGSLRQPYQLRDPTSASSQRTPSIAAIPPSVARVYELANLMPRSVQPKVSWIYGSTVRIVYPPLLTAQRVWMTTASPVIVAVLKEDKTPQIDASIPDVVAAPGAQAEDIGYLPLADGNLLAVDLTAGGGGTLRLVWRANVGGAMDRKPVPRAEGVYVSGVGTGVARVDRKTGLVTWRTEPEHDTLLAVNREHAYVWDRTARVHVYDRLRAGDPVTKQSLPLVSVALPGFSVPVTNGVTDRVMLAGDNGLLVCLRDASPGYARPYVHIAPLHAPPPMPVRQAEVPPPPADTPPPAKKVEKKEPEKKEPEKKD
jgi:outer membrane protein assembly factor BamB